MNLAQLRADLHDAVDLAIERFLATAEPTNDDEAVIAEDEHGPWTYKWPQIVEEFSSSRWYRLKRPTGSIRVLVARTQRDAWGKVRGRTVVFGHPSERSYLPWTEFVETDDGRYAATIPDPERPRAQARSPEQLPDRFADLTVERTDALFDGAQNAPTLRLVARREDENLMILHGSWVAGLRGHRVMQQARPSDAA